MTVEYLEPTTNGRIRLIGYLVLCVLMFTVGRWLLFPFIDSLPPCERLGWTKLVLLGEAAFLTAWALWLIWSAWKTVRFRQVPHPGADVFFRTRVHRGWWLVADILGRMTVFLLLGWLAIKFGPFMMQVVRGVSAGCAA